MSAAPVLSISVEDIRARIARDNPWWQDSAYRGPETLLPQRVYFAPFRRLALNFDVRRATVLLGPRRVGKTVMVKQLVDAASGAGVDPKNILYVSVDTPIYMGIGLEKFLDFMPGVSHAQRCVVIFDEIQYKSEWERHLKDLVDSYPHVKFVASGSAAAALKLRSRESGAGRFSDFMLPPLTFYEYLLFRGETDRYLSITGEPTAEDWYTLHDVDGMNARFIEYLNFGGYPEVVMNPAVRDQSEQFIRNDIIDKVLLKDLPSLYGISDIQELNRLFSFLAYNTGNEASFENISRESAITKPTIKKYVEYLESAFLLIKVATVNENCRSMKRERSFKVYLSNPSMRAALFAPVSPADGAAIGHLTESAIFAQWQHSASFGGLRYARWRDGGEVDVVYLDPGQRPRWVGEIKWSDRIVESPAGEVSALNQLMKRHHTISGGFFTSRTVKTRLQVAGRNVEVIPSAAYCYLIGRNITAQIDAPFLFPQSSSPAPEAT